MNQVTEYQRKLPNRMGRRRRKLENSLVAVLADLSNDTVGTRCSIQFIARAKFVVQSDGP